MFTLQEQQAQKKRVQRVRRSSCCDGVRVLCSPCEENKGLGASDQEEMKKAIAPGEYATVSKGQQDAIMAAKLAASVALTMIPVVGWAAALLINIPVVGDKIFNFGLKYDPILKTFVKAFKKVNPLENCMNAWKYPEEKERFIRGMSPQPLPITAEVRNQYRLEHARDIIVNPSNRQENVVNIFRRLVNENPDILMYECATRAEVRGMTQTKAEDRQSVDAFWGQLRTAAQNEELYKLIGTTAIRVEQKKAVTVEVQRLSTQFQMPVGVTSITKGGVLVLDPKVNANRVLLSSPIGDSKQTRAVSNKLPGF
jgi:hypothetical protein